VVGLLLSAESRVIDVDTSEETAELVKGRILEEVASSPPKPTSIRPDFCTILMVEENTPQGWFRTATAL
jgi:hypothetical protein